MEPRDGSPARIEDLHNRLRRLGMPLTIQRRAIFEALGGRVDHPTADQIFESVGRELPGVSRTTVYRVLEAFVRLGVVRKVDHPGATTRFDPRVDHHHHLICLECETVVDLERPLEPRLSLPSEHETGFRITDYSIHFLGTCPGCQRESSP